MPATTSPLMALRFSGRLMVIHSAWARFSRMTLFWSVIAMLACWSYPAGLVVRDARYGRAPHHEGHLLPSPREAVGKGRGWGERSDDNAAVPAESPPPPTPPRHARCAWREGSSRPHLEELAKQA